MGTKKTPAGKFSAAIEGNMIVLRLPISPRPSNSGKNILLYTTAGNKTLDIEHDGQPIVAGINLYVKATE